METAKKTATATMRLSLSSALDLRAAVAVQSLAAASRVVRAYIEANGLGASDMRYSFGNVTASGTGELVGSISYNGRIWDPYGYEVQA